MHFEVSLVLGDGTKVTETPNWYTSIISSPWITSEWTAGLPPLGMPLDPIRFLIKQMGSVISSRSTTDPRAMWEPCTGLRKEAGENDVVWREHWPEGTLGVSENFVIVQDLESQNNKKSSLRVLDVQQNRNISIFILVVSWSFQMHLNGSGGTGPSASTRVAGVVALGKPSRANGFNEN